MSANEKTNLIPGRGCGPCTACCVFLRIEESSLQKVEDDPCPNLADDGLCRIYEDRPATCRNFYCEWRYLAQLGEEWRPDRSKIMLRSHSGQGGGLILQPLELPLEVLTSRLALGLVASCVSNSIPVYISIPTRAGYNHALLGLNQRLAEPVRARKLDVARNVMVAAIKHASALTTEPIAPLQK
jgi:hypothetical protein